MITWQTCMPHVCFNQCPRCRSNWFHGCILISWMYFEVIWMYIVQFPYWYLDVSPFILYQSEMLLSDWLKSRGVLNRTPCPSPSPTGCIFPYSPFDVIKPLLALWRHESADDITIVLMMSQLCWWCHNEAEVIYRPIHEPQDSQTDWVRPIYCRLWVKEDKYVTPC